MESPGSQDDGAAITAATARSSGIARALGRSGDRVAAIEIAYVCRPLALSLSARSDTYRLTQIILMFARLQAARPRTVNFITGGVVMAVGDAGTQRFVEGASSRWHTDRNLLGLQRERVGAAVNLVHLCRQNLAASLPNKGHRQPNIVALNFVARLCRVVELLEALLQGKSLSAASELTIDTLKREAPSLVATSFCVWLPTNSLMFWLVPNAYRIAFMSSISTVWGGYCSFVAHRGEPPV